MPQGTAIGARFQQLFAQAKQPKHQGLLAASRGFREFARNFSENRREREKEQRVADRREKELADALEREKELIKFRNAEDDERERIKYKDAVNASGSQQSLIVKGWQDFYSETNLDSEGKLKSSDPIQERLFLNQHRTRLGQMSAKDREILGLDDPKDIDRKIEKVDDRLNDSEKIQMRMEIERLKGLEKSAADQRLEMELFNDREAKVTISEIQKRAGEGAEPSELISMMTDVELANPDILKSEIWRQWRLSLKDQAASAKKDGPELAGAQEAALAQEAVDALSTPGGGDIFQDMVIPNDIRAELDKITFGTESTPLPIEILIGEVPVGAETQKVAGAQARDLVGLIKREANAWAAEGFDRKSKHSLLKHSTRKRLHEKIFSEQERTPEQIRQEIERKIPNIGSSLDDPDVRAWINKTWSRLSDDRETAFDKIFPIASPDSL